MQKSQDGTWCEAMSKTRLSISGGNKMNYFINQEFCPSKQYTYCLITKYVLRSQLITRIALVSIQSFTCGQSIRTQKNWRNPKPETWLIFMLYCKLHPGFPFRMYEECLKTNEQIPKLILKHTHSLFEADMKFRYVMPYKLSRRVTSSET
jgi:hypothetical protein